MNKIILISTCLSLFSCSQNNEIKSKKTTGILKIDSLKTENKVQIKEQIDIKTYNGSWFSIDYPSSFKVSPEKPVQKENDYTFVETDEATFQSTDNQVEFFVYSPQWSGDPKNYMNASSNEKLVSQKQEISKKDTTKTTTWLSFADNKKSYTRSVFSVKTENTHLVFGFKYANDAAYTKYKEAYEQFKKSIKQYAD